MYARWDKFDLRPEMATVIERWLRETLGGRVGNDVHDPIADIEPQSFNSQLLPYSAAACCAFAAGTRAAWHVRLRGSPPWPCHDWVPVSVPPPGVIVPL